MSGTLTLTGMSAGLPAGEIISGPVTMTGTSLVGAVNSAALAVGDNTFQVPAGAIAVAIFPGEAPAATIKVRTNLNSGDAGLPVAPYPGLGWVAFPLPTGVTSVIVNASQTVSSVQLFFI
jgi:hypothetical protein